MDKRQYIEFEIRKTLTEMNEFLRVRGVAFAIPDAEIEGFVFYFDGEGQRDRRFRINEKDVEDAYAQGRRIGAIFYEFLNPQVSRTKVSEGVKAAKATKLIRVVEHAFGILNVRREDEEAEILQMPATYPSAKDRPMLYSIMDEDDPHLERETADFIRQEGAEDPKDIEDVLDELTDILGQPPKRRQRPFKESGEHANEGLGISSPQFEAGDLTGYGEVEDIGGLSDNPWAIRADKRGKEEFNIARVIIEGRGEQNWINVLRQLLTADTEEGIKYLAGLYHY